MRFFCIACLFGIIVASLGCMTKNWSCGLFESTLPVGNNQSIVRTQPNDTPSSLEKNQYIFKD